MLTDIRVLTVGEMKTMMRFAVRTGSNMLVLGSAGIGKTDIAEQAAEAEEFESTYLNLSTLEAPDLLGLPRINEKTNKTTYALPEQFPLRGEAGPDGKPAKPRVLIVDELDKAKPELQNPMLELFQRRSINGIPLNFHAILATGNLPDEGAFSQPISHALTNRCSVFKVEADFDTWHKWAVSNSINPLVVGFLSKNTEMLIQKPADGDETAYCHPSPRAWHLASKALNDTSSSRDDVDFQSLMVAGYIGAAAAGKFRVWLEHYRHIEPVIDDLVKSGKHPSGHMELDRQLVCAIAGCDAILHTIKTAEANKKLSESEKSQVITKVVEHVMGWMKGLMPEIQIGAVKTVFNMKIVGDYSLMKIKPFMEVFAKIRKSFEDS